MQSKGIDLEEADGAQDIGHQSIFLFNDPSSGYFGDMWFRGNTQYVLANPSSEGLKPEFGPYTYPSTQSNNGANSYIKIEEISIARDTMRLVISNQLIADGYPQENLKIKAFYDLDRDGINEMFGRIDSLSVWETGDPYNKESFHPILSEEFFISFIEKDEYTVIDIVENFSNSSLHSRYHYNLILESFSFQNQSMVDSLLFPLIDEQNDSLEFKGEYAWNIHSKRIYSNTHSFSIDLGLSGITVEKFGEIEKKWDSKFFNYISGIDLDLDKNNIFILGFSQGADLAMSTSFKFPNTFKGIMALCGYFDVKKIDYTVDENAIKKLNLFLCSAIYDDKVPVHLGRMTNLSLKKLGLETTYHEYDTGHTISNQCLNDLLEWLEKVD